MWDSSFQTVHGYVRAERERDRERERERARERERERAIRAGLTTSSPTTKAH
jgi:hypothetical protein